MDFDIWHTADETAPGSAHVPFLEGLWDEYPNRDELASPLALFGQAMRLRAVRMGDVQHWPDPGDDV